MEFHQSLPKDLKTSVEKQYKRLFGGAISEHILDAIDNDEIFEPNIENDTN